MRPSSGNQTLLQSKCAPLITQLLDFFRKSNTPRVNYPADQWLQVFTAGTILEINGSKANALPSVDVVSHPTARLLQDVVCCTQLLDFFRKSHPTARLLQEIKHLTQLLDFFRKSNTPRANARVNYPADQWLQVFTADAAKLTGP
ncbi:unnamed protein product [Rodentolepis nana]|uniref:Mon2_C domain-containing protein n=1 Tax=Rodentolepis nana TaxID=102285 RepID=A0A0R3TH91_RODNA|nr:unnamed protein product [Rodentolepis nana]